MKYLASSLILTFAFASCARGDEPKVDVQESIRKGLEWLAKNQTREGNWEANGGQYPTSMTAFAGMCFLMEGSTIKEGKYSQNIKKAVDWFMKRSQPNGLLGNPNNPTEATRYLFGHGFGMMFLASIYGEEEDERRRKDLEKLLTKAVEFCGKAQTDMGGWGYVSAAEGNNFDEGSVTITQLQGLRACRNAGIAVPKSIIDKSVEYLKKSTTTNGGIVYSLHNTGGVAPAGTERPPLTAAAVACAFSQGEYKSEYAIKWLKYCQKNIPFGKGRLAHDEYQNYYFSQVMYVLGEDGWEKLVGEKSGMKWSEFRKTMFEYIKSAQAADGSWNGGYIGPVMATSVNLTILQLENGTLPIYQR